MAINRYNYLYNNQFINNNQPSILGPNSDNNLLPEDVSAYIQQLLANISVDRKDNTYRVTPPKETIKPLHEQTQFDNGIKEAEDNFTNTLNSINYDTVRDTVDRTNSLFNKPTNSIQQSTTGNNINVPNTVSNTNIPYSLGVNTAFNTGYTPTVNQLSTGLDYNTLGSYNKAMNATITAPKIAGLSSGAPVESGFDASKATSAVTEGGGSGLKAGAGMAAGLAKAAYNKWAPNIYTIGVDDGLEKAAYESIYGDSHQDPLARAATSIFQTNDQRMSNVLGQVGSRPLDYSGVRNNDNLINAYQDLSDLKTLDYNNPFTWENAGLFAAGVPFLSKNKQIQDFNQSTGQGALAGLSYSGGNGWAALAGAALGSITGIANLIGSKKRTQMYNNAVEKAKRENIESFYNTARRNQDEEIFNSMRMMAEGGSLEELNGVTKFNTGGSHSQNPYDGIQQGIASDGLPNKVEEGELKYNDYIYSARLKPSKSLLKQYNLPEKYAGKSFAEIGDKLQKESEERPNDPISKTTLDEWMLRLQNAQEDYKAKAEERRLAKVVDNMSDEEKAILLSSLEQPIAQQEGIDLSQPIYKSGGKIYIKPENRGKFTALKKRTGKSASWFKAHGTPAQKKMATFALNAKHWNHKGAYGLNLDIPPYADTSSPYYGLEGLEITPKEYIPLNVVTSDIFPDEPDNRSDYLYTSYMKPISPDAVYDKHGNIRYNDLDRMYSDPNHRPTTFDGINEEKYFDMFYHPIGNKFIYESFPADANEKWFTALSKLPEFQALKNKPKDAKEAYNWFNAYAAQERPMDDFAALVNSLRIKNSPLQTKVTTKPEGWDYLKETPSDETTPTSSLKRRKRTNNSDPTEMLRYAPAVGAGLSALYAWTQPKDYEYPNELRELATEFKPISAPHVGGRLSYTPYDVNLGDAENLALLTSTLRANRVRANRGQEAAGAIGLLNTFEKQNALRNLEWQQANEANRKAITQYNLGIDQFNAQRDSQYDQLNQQILNNRLNMLSNAAQAADASRTAWAANINSTTENFFNQLGNVGRDEWNRNQRDFLLKALGREGLLESIKSGYFKS